ncbi:MAG TPA: hypothetical protein VN683_09395 [Acidothermaceae bacterium]|nr:hypothetical protein [Acidothermaceae bacterium]
MFHQEFTAPARHEHAWIDRDALTAELRPAEHLFKGQAGNALFDEPCKVGRRRCCRDKQLRFVLGEYATSRA